MTGVARACGWLGVAMITLLSLVPGHARPHVLPVGQFEHVIAYCVTAAALAWGYRRSLMTAGLLLTAYAAVLEIGQLFVPDRASQLIDVAASALGVWIGIGLVVLLRRARAAAATPGPD